jgi:glycosyltransferase involved in cell wall biosynthesis
MSQGTPVITTNRTAGQEFISNGENGWLVEAGSTEALEDTIEEILQRPEILEVAGRNAMNTAAKRPWSSYGDELAGQISKIFKGDNTKIPA